MYQVKVYPVAHSFFFTFAIAVFFSNLRSIANVECRCKLIMQSEMDELWVFATVEYHLMPCAIIEVLHYHGDTCCSLRFTKCRILLCHEALMSVFPPITQVYVFTCICACVFTHDLNFGALLPLIGVSVCSIRVKGRTTCRSHGYTWRRISW